MADSSRQLGDEALPSTNTIRTLATKCWHNGYLDEVGRTGGLQLVEKPREAMLGELKRNKNITGFYNELQVFGETFARLRRSLVVSREALV